MVPDPALRSLSQWLAKLGLMMRLPQRQEDKPLRLVLMRARTRIALGGLPALAKVAPVEVEVARVGAEGGNPLPLSSQLSSPKWARAKSRFWYGACVVFGL